MQFGYVLCNQNRSKILTLTKDKQVRMITSNKENIEKAFCLNNMSAVKSIYEKFKEKKLVKDLIVVNIQEFYRAD
tara:strand:+ start:571 stop:795 length:225 start_codon:yes stop_codon:yes gene_type:complete